MSTGIKRVFYDLKISRYYQDKFRAYYDKIRDMKEEKNGKFVEIYKDNFNLLYGYAYRMIGDKYLAEDAVHNACYAALKKGIFENHDNPLGWLFIALRFEINNTIRKNREIPLNESELTAEAADEKFGLLELDLSLRSALTKKEYIIAKMYFFEGVSEKDIANYLGISLNALRIRIHRIREKILSIDLSILIILLISRSLP